MPTLQRKKPKAIVFDVTGTVAKKAFMTNSEESKAFIQQYIRQYVQECWPRKEMRLAINFLRKPPTMIRNVPQTTPTAPPIADITAPIEDQMESLIQNVLARLDKEALTPPIAYFHLTMSDWGYSKGLICTPVYEEVGTVLKKWKEQDIKLYVTIGSAPFLRKVFSKTSAGDLLPLIEGHMNLMGSDGTKKDFSKLSQLLGEHPTNILFITRLPQDARRANNAQIPSIIILRSDFDPKGVQILRTLDKSKPLKTQKSSIAGPMSTLNPDEQRAVASNIETLTSVADDEGLATNATSKVTEKDLRDFPVIQKLDDLIWI